MALAEIEVTVVKIDEPGTQCQKIGDTFIIGKRTPSGMCCAAFQALYPRAAALAWSGPRDENRTLDVVCPDGKVVYRLKAMSRPLRPEPGGQST